MNGESQCHNHHVYEQKVCHTVKNSTSEQEAGLCLNGSLDEQKVEYPTHKRMNYVESHRQNPHVDEQRVKSNCRNPRVDRQ